MPRMKVLNPTEQEAFDKPPVLTDQDRKRFFDFTADVWSLANSLRNPAHKIGFTVACGYFRATRKLFTPEDYRQKDIEWVGQKLGIDSEVFSTKHYQRSRIHHHRQLILKTFGYGLFDTDAEAFIRQKISEMLRAQLKPKFIFWRCVELLIKSHKQVPKYNQLAKIIILALNQRKQELITLIDSELSDHARSVLDSLFLQEHSVAASCQASQYSRYKLTLLKKLSQSTKPSRVRERVDDLVYLQGLYEYIEMILPVLGFGPQAIRYYANSVIKSDIFHLSRRADEDRYVHVIAFIAHQYYRLQDNLTDVLLTVVQSYQNNAVREHRDWCYYNRKLRDNSLQSLLNVLDSSILGAFTDIGAVVKNRDITDAQKITQIEKLVTSHSNAIERSKTLKESLEKGIDDKHYFEILASRSVRLQNRISPIVKALKFQAEPGAVALMEAIAHFKNKDGNITKNAPVGFLETGQRIAVTPGGTLHTSLYKVFLFIHIAAALKSGTINLKHSYKYRPLDDYLIPKEQWAGKRNSLIEQAELSEFSVLSSLLNILDTALYRQFQKTNDLYRDGTNSHLKVTTGRGLTITTPKQQEDPDSTATLQLFFPDKPVPLVQVLSTVNRYTVFLEEFRHWQQRYTKINANRRSLYAGIIGKGCAIGTPKIARISSQINEKKLSHVINWYFSLENVQAANNRIIKMLDSMALPQIYRRSQQTLHTASDGQKFTVRTDSLNANYSFKYFGNQQGVSAYTFIDERHLLWHSLVFSAAERESAYVIDGLMRNDVIKSDIHSTDTHGYSEAIFAVTHLLGISYAPRIKNLKSQTLYTFKSHKITAHPEWEIAPDKYINEDILHETWDDVLRLVATIKLKQTTASDIFRRLNSYSKQHRLYQGLKAFGQIIKSLFILRYLDDVELRQSIEKQLNKVELANRFTRAVAVGDPRGFTQAEKEEQEIAEACNRLIKNGIICWNYLYLSDKLRRLEKQPEQQKMLLSAIATHSVISWAHINMLGQYDFSDDKMQDAFGIRPPISEV